MASHHIQDFLATLKVWTQYNSNTKRIFLLLVGKPGYKEWASCTKILYRQILFESVPCRVHHQHHHCAIPLCILTILSNFHYIQKKRMHYKNETNICQEQLNTQTEMCTKHKPRFQEDFKASSSGSFLW